MKKLITAAVIATTLTGCSSFMYDTKLVDNLESKPGRDHWDDIPPYSVCDTGKGWTYFDYIVGGVEIGAGIALTASGYPIGLLDVALGSWMVYEGNKHSGRADTCADFKQYKLEQDYKAGKA